jgi:HSP20 family protein
MATQDTKENETQNQSSQGKGNQGRSSQGSMARRTSVPASVITPIDFFGMNPFSLMRRMTEEMDRVFGDGGTGRESNTDALWSPAVEVSERDGNYVIRAELPGLNPEDVKLEVENDAVVIQGERKLERDVERGGMHRTEIRYGRFYRTIPLPEGVNAEQVRAKFDNGVLEVTVPVPEQQSQRKQIPIQSSSTASPNAG